MQKRFEADPLFQATMLLLQEKIPKATAFYSHSAELSDLRTTNGAAETPVRILSTANTPVPEVQLLSNGRYHVMVTNTGGGYSRWKDLAVTRWREDSTLTTGERSVTSATSTAASSGRRPISRR